MQRKTITGEPYYQVYKNFDYWLKFNNQNSTEEKNVKLLLCMPLVPPEYHCCVSLMTEMPDAKKKSPSRRRRNDEELM